MITTVKVESLLTSVFLQMHRIHLLSAAFLQKIAPHANDNSRLIR